MSYVSPHPAHLVAASMPAFPIPPGVTAHVIPQAPPPPPQQQHLQPQMQVSAQGLPMLPNAPLPQSMLADVKPNKRKKNYSKHPTATAAASSSTSAAALQVNRNAAAAASAANGRPASGGPSASLAQGAGSEDVKLDTLFAVKDKCEFCDYVCDKRDRMRRHIRSMHYNYKVLTIDESPRGHFVPSNALRLTLIFPSSALRVRPVPIHHRPQGQTEEARGVRAL